MQVCWVTQAQEPRAKEPMVPTYYKTSPQKLKFCHANQYYKPLGPPGLAMMFSINFNVNKNLIIYILPFSYNRDPSKHSAALQPNKRQLHHLPRQHLYCPDREGNMRYIALWFLLSLRYESVTFISYNTNKQASVKYASII